MKVTRRHLVAIVMGLLVGFGALLSPALADDKPFDPVSVTLSINQDKFFGFYPIIQGTYYLRKDLGVAWGSTLYQKFGQHAGADFSSPWTWVYAGLHKSFMDGKLTFRPQFGFTNGMIQSSGAGQMGAAGGQPAIVGMGILGMIQSHYAGEMLDWDFYFLWLQDLRHIGPAHSSFDHLWYYAGVPVVKTESGSKLIVGGYYEHVYAVQGGSACAACGIKNAPVVNLPPQALFQWLGGYVEWRMTKGMSFFFAAGKDLVTNASGQGIKAGGEPTNGANLNPSGDFYKVRFSKSF